MGEITINPIHNVHKKYRQMNLVNPYRFAPPILPFVSTWNTANTSAGSSTSTQVKLPLIAAGTYNFVVQWGDGNSDTITVWNQAQTTHTYTLIGNYTVTITGICTGWQFNDNGDKLKFSSVQSWGNFKLGSTGSYFMGCANLNLANVTDILDTSQTTSFSRIFRGCSALTTVNNISSWNTALVTNLAEAFLGCVNFNSDLNSWNTNSLTGSLNHCFANCYKFNSDLSNWNVSNITNFSSTFSNCYVFNGNITNWNTAKVTTFEVTFSGCAKFNQNIGGWNTGLVTNMYGMFAGCTIFNQNLNSWNTINVNNIAGMFQSCTAFNGDISSWNTAKVTRMEQMFYLATAFNQNIGGWNTGLVTNMFWMFRNATAFNQNIGGWNVSNVTNLQTFMNGKNSVNFSSSNLDAIYNEWSSRPVKPNISTDFGTAKYTIASSAGRAILTGAPNNWIITDGGI